MARCAYRPWLLAAACWIGLAGIVPNAVLGVSFLRGDTNLDGAVNVSDPIYTLGYLFSGTPTSLACDDAGDANDDGEVNITDPVATLNFLFSGGPPPPLPGPVECGPDPTADELDCAEFPPCADPAQYAEVLEVSVSGAPAAFTFAVTVRSPDTGCDQYADWWEVVTPAGELVYRRVLAHSHVSEQPFRRTGGPVEIDASTDVIVRAHMNTVGYGTQAYRGSPATGFAEVELASDFAAGLESQEPLPTGCAF